MANLRGIPLATDVDRLNLLSSFSNLSDEDVLPEAIGDCAVATLLSVSCNDSTTFPKRRRIADSLSEPDVAKRVELYIKRNDSIDLPFSVGVSSASRVRKRPSRFFRRDRLQQKR